MMYGYGSWDMKCKGQNLLSFWAILFPFDAPSNPKSQKFEKIKKMLDDIIILPLRTTNDNHDVWFLIYQARQTYDIWFLGSSLAIFCPFTPLKWKYHKIEKKKKKKKYLEISFYTSVPKIMIIGYTVPEIWHMMDVIIIFLGYFLPFYCSNHQKNENVKKIKKHLEISWFYTSAGKFMIICYTAPEIWCMIDLIVLFHFGLFFALLPPPCCPPHPPNSLKNINFKTMKKKKTLEILFYTSVQKIMIISYTFPEIWHVMYVIVVFDFGQFLALLPR